MGRRMGMVAVDGYLAEMQDNKVRRQEEYMQVEGGGGVAGRLIQK